MDLCSLKVSSCPSKLQLDKNIIKSLSTVSLINGWNIVLVAMEIVTVSCKEFRHMMISGLGVTKRQWSSTIHCGNGLMM